MAWVVLDRTPMHLLEFGVTVQVVDRNNTMWTVIEQFTHFGIEMYLLENATHFSMKPIMECEVICVL